MIVQTLFDRMMLYDNQFDLIAGGDDVTRGLTAINLVQDWWEAVAAKYPGLTQTHSTFTTTANTEKTAWPSGLLRLEGLWREDGSGNAVVELDPIDIVGGHMPSMPWPIALVAANNGTGAPCEYYPQGQGGSFYWAPTPDAVYTMRAYGLWEVADYTAAANTFGSPNSVALAMVPLAANILKLGLGRDLADVQTEAEAAFHRAVKGLERQVRVQPQSRVYLDAHEA